MVSASSRHGIRTVSSTAASAGARAGRGGESGFNAERAMRSPGAPDAGAPSFNGARYVEFAGGVNVRSDAGGSAPVTLLLRTGFRPFRALDRGDVQLFDMAERHRRLVRYVAALVADFGDAARGFEAIAVLGVDAVAHHVEEVAVRSVRLGRRQVAVMVGEQVLV